MAKEVLTRQSDDFPRWYQEVVAKAELAENGPVRGTMIIRPTAYAVWERMQADMDARIKAAGAQNAYFPLLIPQSYLSREADHVEGFSPELAVVTHAGGKELDEPVVVRPTSETIIGESMARWTQSHRDLPLLLNQWANVVRWELRPRVFLRTSEFLWQEGHTAHATADEARSYARRIHEEVYARFMRETLAMPVVLGRKTRRERFAGAINTLTCEAMMRDGKALQMATSHEFGQNFAKAFDIDFLTETSTRDLVWTTSWGSSTRMFGGLVMCHGDDRGLRLPPLLAAVQVLVMVVKDGEGVMAMARGVVEDLSEAGVRTALDDRLDTAFGRRAVDAELKGVPIRIEVGPRDVVEGSVVLVRRIAGGKTPTLRAGVVAQVRASLDADQKALYEESLAFAQARTVDVATLEDARGAAVTGWARIPWKTLGEEGEAKLAESAISVRCLTRSDGSVPASDDEDGVLAIVGRSY